MAEPIVVGFIPLENIKEEQEYYCYDCLAIISFDCECNYDAEAEYQKLCNEQYYLRLIASDEVSAEHKREYRRKLKELEV